MQLEWQPICAAASTSASGTLTDRATSSNLGMASQLAWQFVHDLLVVCYKRAHANIVVACSKVSMHVIHNMNGMSADRLQQYQNVHASPLGHKAITSTVLGPYTAYAAATCSLPLRPMRALPGQMPKMLPTAKLAPTMLLPSSGSKAT